MTTSSSTECEVILAQDGDIVILAMKDSTAELGIEIRGWDDVTKLLNALVQAAANTFGPPGPNGTVLAEVAMHVH